MPDRAEPDGAPRSQNLILLDDQAETRLTTAAIHDSKFLSRLHLWIPACALQHGACHRASMRATRHPFTQLSLDKIGFQAMEENLLEHIMT